MLTIVQELVTLFIIVGVGYGAKRTRFRRSEEHTSELQSLSC